MTKRERMDLYNELSRKFDVWAKASDADLFAEVSRAMGLHVVEATRDECIKFFVMDYVEKML